MITKIKDKTYPHTSQIQEIESLLSYLLILSSIFSSTMLNFILFRYIQHII